ncbi:MAG: recombinase family protein, partial [Hyphomicrobiaceae bacterium]
MTTSEALLPATLLQRKAIVYVRQSTQQQVQSNLESQRRQYELVEVARRRGFDNVEVIDDDLGRSASGAVERPGFERLVAALCAGQVGAVLCLDASRLARNGRDWHHLSGASPGWKRTSSSSSKSCKGTPRQGAAPPYSLNPPSDSSKTHMNYGFPSVWSTRNWCSNLPSQTVSPTAGNRDL